MNVQIIEKTHKEIDEALTDGPGIPEGQVWLATGKLRTYTVACNNTAVIRILRGYALPTSYNKVSVMEPKGSTEIKNRIQEAWKKAMQAN